MTPDPLRLDGRVVAVVGAGSGIGEAVARACAASGARVVALDRDQDAAFTTTETILEAGGEARAIPLDIGDGDAVRGALEEIVESEGRLDGLVCTPGINVRKPLLEYTEDEFDRVVGLNLKGTFFVLRAAGRLMARQGSGSIVLLSSIRSLVIEPGQSVYAATKAGLVQMARTLAAELGPSGVRVNALAPGVVDTPLTAPIKADPAWYEAYAAKTVLGRWARPEEIAGPTVFLLCEASSYVTGAVLFVDGGWTAADGRFRPPEAST